MKKKSIFSIVILLCFCPLSFFMAYMPENAHDHKKQAISSPISHVSKASFIKVLYQPARDRVYVYHEKFYKDFFIKSPQGQKSSFPEKPFFQDLWHEKPFQKGFKRKCRGSSYIFLNGKIGALTEGKNFFQGLAYQKGVNQGSIYAMNDTQSPFFNVKTGGNAYIKSFFNIPDKGVSKSNDVTTYGKDRTHSLLPKPHHKKSQPPSYDRQHNVRTLEGQSLSGHHKEEPDTKNELLSKNPVRGNTESAQGPQTSGVTPPPLPPRDPIQGNTEIAQGPQTPRVTPPPLPPRDDEQEQKTDNMAEGAQQPIQNNIPTPPPPPLPPRDDEEDQEQKTDNMAEGAQQPIQNNIPTPPPPPLPPRDDEEDQEQKMDNMAEGAQQPIQNNIPTPPPPPLPPRDDDVPQFDEPLPRTEEETRGDDKELAQYVTPIPAPPPLPLTAFMTQSKKEAPEENPTKAPANLFRKKTFKERVDENKNAFGNDTHNHLKEGLTNIRRRAYDTDSDSDEEYEDINDSEQSYESISQGKMGHSGQHSPDAFQEPQATIPEKMIASLELQDMKAMLKKAPQDTNKDRKKEKPALLNSPMLQKVDSWHQGDDHSQEIDAPQNQDIPERMLSSWDYMDPHYSTNPGCELPYASGKREN